MPIITRDVALASARLRAGDLVAIPTETVYGLAADARNPHAIAKVYALKGRPSSNPLIVHVGEADWVSDWVAEVPPGASALMRAFWPGPLTLVLTARADVPRIVTADQDTVAIRQPDHPLCLDLLHHLGRAVVAPSANRYMSISPTTAEHVARQFPHSDLLILDGGPCRVGVESTIVSLLTEEPARLLRPGMLGRDAIEPVLGSRLLAGDSSDIRVPGQHQRHYAPGTPAWHFREPDADALRDPGVGWIFCGQSFEVDGPALDLGTNPDRYAQRLYAALYRLDHAGLRALLIQRPPDTDAWHAIQDRIDRAAQPL